MKHSIFPRTIARTDRYEVIRESATEVVLYFDGEFVQYYASADAAEHAAAMRIEEEARDLAAGLVDEQCDDYHRTMQTKWYRSTDLPCQNKATVTVGAMKFCPVCANAHGGKAVQILGSRDNLGFIPLDNPRALAARWAALGAEVQG